MSKGCVRCLGAGGYYQLGAEASSTADPNAWVICEMCEGTGTACEKGLRFRDLHLWETRLNVGDEVEARWSAGSGGHFRAHACVLKINRASIVVTLCVETQGYPAGRKINVPKADADRWTRFNGVFPWNPAKGA